MKTDKTVNYFDKLPTRSLAVLPGDERLIICIHRGTKGYTPLSHYATKEEAAALVRAVNARKGVTPAQAEAMVVGSMFGWHVPAANPDLYDDTGRLVR